MARREPAKKRAARSFPKSARALTLLLAISELPMELPTDLQKLEEAMSLIASARLRITEMGKRPDDLESLLSVAASEAKRVYAELVAGKTAPGTIPVILSETKPKR